MKWFHKKGTSNVPPTEVPFITLGEKYPGNIELGRDYILPIVTLDGLNILISLTQLDEDIENSILDNQFNAYFTSILGLPLVAFQFDCGINLDWSLNVMKVSDQYRGLWLNNSNTNIMITLIEAETGIVKGVRYLDLPFLNDIKDCCHSQLNSSIAEIDSFLNTVRSRLDVNNIIIGAQQVHTVPEAMSL